MGNMHKFFQLVLILFLIFSLTACETSAVELNNRSFVKMIIIDKTKNGIELTLVFPLTNRLVPGQVTGGQTGKPYTFVTKKGKDISDALQKIQADISRQISFGQTNVVIIGKQMAKAGVSPIFEFLTRNAKFHINSYIFVTSGKGKELTNFPVVFERFPSDILVSYGRNKFTLATTVKDFLMAHYSGVDMIVPILAFAHKKTADEKKSWMGTDGAAIFRQGKLVSALNKKEMLGGLFILNQWKNKEIGIPSPKDGKLINFLIPKVHTKVKPIINGDQILIKIQMNGEANVTSADSYYNLTDVKQVKILENKLEKEIKKRINSAISTSIAAKADVFNFGNYVAWKYPRKWESVQNHWREVYINDVKFSIQVNVPIHSLGTELLPTTNKRLGKETNE